MHTANVHFQEDLNMSEIKKSGLTADTDIKKTTTSAVKPVDAVKKAAASVKASVESKAAEEIKKPAAEVKKAAEEVKTEVKKAAAATKTTAVAAKKRATARKSTAKTAAKKTAAAKMNSAVYIQFNDLNISSEGLVTRVKEIWAERGNKEADLRDVKVYVNVAESKAYYVVNEDVFGEFDL
jgi:hypothetical protein